MKKRQREELRAVQQQSEKDAAEAEQRLRTEAEKELEQALREKKNRQAAEIAARPDLSKEQMDAVRNYPIIEKFLCKQCSLKLLIEKKFPL